MTCTCSRPHPRAPSESNLLCCWPWHDEPTLATMGRTAWPGEHPAARRLSSHARGRRSVQRGSSTCSSRSGVLQLESTWLEARAEPCRVLAPHTILVTRRVARDCLTNCTGTGRGRVSEGVTPGARGTGEARVDVDGEAPEKSFGQATGTSGATTTASYAAAGAAKTRLHRPRRSRSYPS